MKTSFYRWRSWSLAGCLALGALVVLTTAHEASAAEATADREFAALQALVEKSVNRPAGLKDGSEAEFAWRNGLALEIHERGLAFFTANPTDPRRWEVVIFLRGTPTFLQEVEENGQKRVERDRMKQSAWSRRHDDLLEELLRASDASSQVTRAALLSLLTRHSSNWRSWIKTEGGMIMLEKMEAWYVRYQREFPRSIAIVEAARALAQVLAMDDPFRCQKFLEELLMIYASNRPPDPEVREMAEGRLKLLHGLASPVSLKLTGPGGEVFDSREYRGKILLVAVLSVAWRDEQHFLRTVHAQYRTAGVEIVQISGMENRDRTDLPDLFTAAGRAQEEKRYPWRIVWDKQGTIGEFARSIGINGFPSWMLLGREGQLVVEKASPREVMAAIEKELETERRKP